MQINLFGPILQPSFDPQVTPPIEGISYLPDFITPEDERMLVKMIDAGTWILDLKRRVQHFGYKYNYKIRRIDATLKLGRLPEWLELYCYDLFQKGIFAQIPDQVIVNEYLPGQGITPHIDCEPCFGDTIASLSLNSTAMMDFIKAANKTCLFLERRSLIVLKGDARYLWSHTIPARKTDSYMGNTYLRKRRISITFRKVIL